MSLVRTCPRCGSAVRQPGLYSSSWLCDEHGEVLPAVPAVAPTPDLIRRLGRDSRVPVWVPWPLPEAWLVSGLRWAGDEPSGTLASVVSISGPHPIPEVGDEDLSADLVLVAEQPGVGLGPHLAGLREIDPGPLLAQRVAHEPAEARIVAGGHEVPLWSVPTPEGMAYVGEAAGVWLWILAWPASAAVILLDGFQLLDAAHAPLEVEPPCGALTPRLVRTP